MTKESNWLWWFRYNWPHKQFDRVAITCCFLFDTCLKLPFFRFSVELLMKFVSLKWFQMIRQIFSMIRGSCNQFLFTVCLNQWLIMWYLWKERKTEKIHQQQQQPNRTKGNPMRENNNKQIDFHTHSCTQWKTKLQPSDNVAMSKQLIGYSILCTRIQYSVVCVPSP